jgi:eukaryotic-like serine/threonine-protein kinase
MQASPAAAPGPRIIGRYALYGEIASGGMATVHFGRLVGAVGFSRTVAIKRLHPQFAKDPDFVHMFLDEARLAARIQHPNVVNTIDVVPLDDEVFLVMEYVHGEALSKLIRSIRRRGELVPPRIAIAIIAGTLHGLHAAHEAKSERGLPLNIVHRDVSPQNILVGVDGVPRVLDFGVAKAAARATSTRDGQMKGKVAYMAPEQLRGKGVDRRTDVFAAGIVLWETLTGRRLFDGDDPGEVLTKLLEAEIHPPSSLEASVPQELDSIVMRALSRDINQRWNSAREMAIALEYAGPIALAREVGEWVERVGGETIGRRTSVIADMEQSSASGLRPNEPSSAAAPLGPSSLPFAATAAYSAHAATGWQPGEPTTSPSQVSHVTGISHPSNVGPASLATGMSGAGVEPKRTGFVAALIGVAAALAIALIVFVVVLAGRARHRDAESSVEAVAPTAPTAARTEAPEVTLTPDAPPTVSVPAPTSAEALPPEEAPKPAPTTTRRVPHPGPVKHPPKNPAAPESNCDPPYTIDKGGVRRVKPGCM